VHGAGLGRLGAIVSETRRKLDRLARHYGIEPSYKDNWQRRHVTPTATQRALLAAMGVPATTNAEVDHSLALTEHELWHTALAPVIVTPEPNVSATVTLPARARSPVGWKVTTEAGEALRGEHDLGSLDVMESADVDRTSYRRYRLPLTALPQGYHRLELIGDKPAHASLIVAPSQAFGVDSHGAGGRLWGVTAPLYGLRSQSDWGMGDFTDLSHLATLCGRLGASFLGINPIHAQFPAVPEHYSPYSPSSRRFLNVLLIAVEDVPELAHCKAAQNMLAGKACQSRLQRMRSAELIDYPAVAALKLELLCLLFATLVRTDGQRLAAFEAFRRRSGQALERQARFDALLEHFRARDPASASWRAWPAPYRDPDSAEVARFADEHRERVDFFAYLQWLAHEQLDRARDQAVADMGCGLYLDLAVGVSPDGADTWAFRDSIVEGASLGAPPDAFNHAGQNWGLAPLSPRGLRKHHYAPLIAILRSAMRYAGVLRIDHILGLQRSFWWPAERGLAGAYVRQPLEDMLGIVALESHRQRCTVVGEDLGTVPSGLRKELRDSGVLGCSVLYFERGADGNFLPVARYRPASIASVGTHDLPPLAGFWKGRDIERRAELGLFEGEQQVAQAHSERRAERQALLHLLEAEGVLPSGIGPDAAYEELPHALMLALHRLLARSPARLMALQIEDVLGATEQANMPGTIDQYPNWRRRLELTLESLDRSPALKELAEVINQERPRKRHQEEPQRSNA